LSAAADDNRLTYLHGFNPYYVGRDYPKLITPQWVGEDGVEAVVILGIDDMRDPKKYEAFLRPILNRLKKIDGRAPLSIMTCNVKPDDPQLQAWLKEGLSLETHTVDHPCPLLKDGDFAKAKSTYDRCVDLMNQVPNGKPVAFRTPCCDSLNTVSPRIYSEIFAKTTAKGNFLTIDTSVFNLFTANDPELPRELVLESGGQERFRKYLPQDRTFVNYIEDYPYPYVIGGTCWEFPCVVPSDWSAQHYHKQNASPITLRDWKAALDATVIKKGVFCLVFHPYGWSSPEQIVDLIDHAVTKHGKKVKFLNFRDAQERLDKNLLGGRQLRDPKTGAANDVAVSTLHDGFGSGDRGHVMVILGKKPVQVWRMWKDGWNVYTTNNPGTNPAVDPVLRLHLGGETVFVRWTGDKTVFELYDSAKSEWKKTDLALPPGAVLGDGTKDTGVRFIDLDEDGYDDIVFSNDKEYGIYLFTDLEHRWSKKVMAGKAGEPGALPPIAKNGTNNGFFVHSRSLWWQNENTNLLPDHLDRRSFNDLLMNVEPTGKSPEASLRCIKARPGFTVELVAAEPLVQSPIAFAWGPDGKLWVVEMGDYPLGVDGKGKPGGRVKYLEDTKGTGKYDKATVFLDNLPFPTGVMPWRKGVIVTCAPDIFYAEDTKGTGKADLRVPLYSGFREGNQQHRVNGLVWGLDNWIYCANGDSGGLITSAKRKQAPLDMRGRDLRIRPDTGEMDLVSGQTQYGRSRDDWGNWFGNNNSWPMYHYALDDYYIRRNPHVAAPDPRVQVSETPGASRVYPISRTMPRFNDPKAANHFTSACSAIVYRDELFTPVADAPGSPVWTFVSEPVHNLVHREIMRPSGTTFTSRRATDEQQSEFLASSDNWFRPTMIQTGPDGALWIADMYRAVIEHPEWIPKDWQQRIDLRAGHDKGRIYRVYPVGAKPRAIPRLDKLDTAGLVAALDSPSGWQRDMAQMMLYWKQDKAAVPLLEKMATESTRPLARLHALCALDALDALRPELLVRALADKHPAVRRHAVRLCAPQLAKSPDVAAALAQRLYDDDPQVHLQLAYTLGEWDDVRAGRWLGWLATKYEKDRFVTAAVMSSVNAGNLETVLTTLLDVFQTGAATANIEYLLRVAFAEKQTKVLTRIFRELSAPIVDKDPAWRFAALAGLLDALDQRKTSLVALRDDGDKELKAAVDGLGELFKHARARVTATESTKEQQLAAVRLLGRGLDQKREDIELLAGLLVPQTDRDLQTAAVAALGKLSDARIPDLLVRGWKGHPPGLRLQVLDALLLRDDRTLALLDALENKKVQAAELDAVRRQRLLDHKDARIRERAAKVLAGAIAPDRQKVIDSYQPVLKLTGDTGRGSKVFAKTCATCHRLGDVGHVVGPDLASVGDKSPQGLLVAILDPNRVVEARYVNYLAHMKNGQTFTGVVGSETGNSVTLVEPDGKQRVLLRTDLEELVSTGKSLMPDGLEKDVTHQDMADLIAFVRGAAPVSQRKTFDGNSPATVKPGADGVLLLTATNAEIYGHTLVFERQYGNLGYWTSDDDQAVWTVELPKPGRYTVLMEWACDNGVAGKRFVIECGTAEVSGKVEGTGNWDRYKKARVGELTLAAGPQRLTFRPGQGLRNSPLIDLKAIKLVPAK
jgi:putative membrane-bound dehydrogenase-like protein